MAPTPTYIPKAQMVQVANNNPYELSQDLDDYDPVSATTYPRPSDATPFDSSLYHEVTCVHGLYMMQAHCP